MKFNKTQTLEELATFLASPFKGDGSIKITGINEIHKVEPGDVVFVDHSKYHKKALTSAADVILIDQEVEFPEGKGIIICDQPFDAFNKITKHFSPFKQWTEVRGNNLAVGENTIIHPNVVIGHDVSIGKNCLIHAGVVICNNTIIEDFVEIGPNSIIGYDAFYYKKKSPLI